MNKYKVHVSPNDDGERLVVLTTASTIQQAQKQVADYLGCPMRSVMAMQLKENE